MVMTNKCAWVDDSWRKISDTVNDYDGARIWLHNIHVYFGISQKLSDLLQLVPMMVCFPSKSSCGTSHQVKTEDISPYSNISQFYVLQLEKLLHLGSISYTLCEQLFWVAFSSWDKFVKLFISLKWGIFHALVSWKQGIARPCFV